MKYLGSFASDKDVATKDKIPTAISDLTNDSNFIEKPSSSTAGNIAVFDADSNCVDSGSGVGDFLKYTTTAPTATNNNGIKVCVLSSEPATKYNGWLYIITE